MIRTFKTSDIDQVVEVHLSSFPGFFLSSLGSRFLKQFYSSLYFADEGITFVYVDKEDTVFGFVAGTTNPSGFYSRLLRQDWWKFASASIVPILKNPLIIGRLGRALFHPSKNPIGDDVAGLFSIGVLPKAQGAGMGKILVRGFLEEARNRGCKKVYLTTDSDHNENSNRFYSDLGFIVKRQFKTYEDRKMNEYWMTLSNDMF